MSSSSMASVSKAATERFMSASAKGAKVVIASAGVAPLRFGGGADPHAWQSVANTKIYVANIRDALIAADPADKSTFEANATAYLQRLDALDADVKASYRCHSAGPAQAHHHP